MAIKERILITVRTYPTISRRHVETVCTGGITDRGEWRRLYPVPLRYIQEDQQFATFDVVEVGVRPGDDGRPESRKPSLETLKIVSTVAKWPARCQWVNPTINPSMAAMLTAGRTLAPVAVAKAIDLVAEPCEADWSPEQKELLKQTLMFGERLPLEKIPFEFRLIWRDGDGQEHRSLVLTWELYQTWRAYKARYRDPVATMREKFLGDVFGPGRQLSLFMGNHSRWRQNWMVCGWFCPPKDQASDESLF